MDSINLAMAKVTDQPAARPTANLHQRNIDMEFRNIETTLTTAPEVVKQRHGPITAQERRYYEFMTHDQIIALKPMSWRQLTASIPGLNTTRELDQWLRLDIFLAPYLTWLEEHLIPTQNELSRGLGYAAISQVVWGQDQARTKDLLYSSPESRKKWTDPIWMGATLLQIFTRDHEHPRSLFAGAPLYSLEKKYAILYKLLQRAKFDARKEKRDGLYSHLQLSEEKIEALQQLAAQYPPTAEQAAKIKERSEKIRQARADKPDVETKVRSCRPNLHSPVICSRPVPSHIRNQTNTTSYRRPLPHR